MDAPSSPTALAAAAGISVPYASQILGGTRQPARALAIHIFRRTGWRHPLIAPLDDAQIEALEAIEIWSPKVKVDAHPAVAICPRCDERADQEIALSCTSAHCPMRQREAA